MRVLSLVAENFKRLHAVELTLEAGVFVIAGRNAQGKSSILDAFWAALGGADAAPGVPVRQGEAGALSPEREDGERKCSLTHLFATSGRS